MSYYALGPHSNILVCKVDNPCKGCNRFQPHDKPYTVGDLECIGWCKRFGPDPEGGYVFKRTVPPCVAWGYEGKRKERVNR